MHTNDISLTLRYHEKGIVASKVVNETVYLFIDDIDWMEERQESFEKSLKKALTVFNRKGVWDVEITIRYTIGHVQDAPLARVSREHGDLVNDVYTLYKYGTKTNTVDINKMSKRKLTETLLEVTREKAAEALTEVRSKEGA